jgi:hypothetical protein
MSSSIRRSPATETRRLGVVAESYGERRERPELVRLSPHEASALRYVLGGLSCQDSAAWTNAPSWEPPSSCGPMIERLQAQAMDDSSHDPDEETVYVHGSYAAADPHRDALQERFGDMPRDRLVSVLAAWASLRLLFRSRDLTRFGVAMVRLYGPEPPGLLPRFHQGHRWPPAVDDDYRRVVKLVSEAEVGGVAALERALHIDDRKREGENDRARSQRVIAAEQERRDLLLRLGRACEKLIEEAVGAYRNVLEDP